MVTMLRINLQASRRLACALFVSHGGAGLCLLALALPAAVKLVLGCLLVASLGYSLAAHAYRRLFASVVTVAAAGDGRWLLITRGGRALTTRLAPGSYLHPQLIVLRFAKDAPWSLRSVVLLPDMVAGDLFRELRVRLRCGVAGGTANGAR